MTTAQELKKIEAQEKKILQKEAKIDRSEKVILAELTAVKDIESIHKRFVRRISKHKLVITMLATFGSVLVWRGLWESVEFIPFLSNALLSVIVGVFLLWMIKRYTDLH